MSEDQLSRQDRVGIMAMTTLSVIDEILGSGSLSDSKARRMAQTALSTALTEINRVVLGELDGE